MPPQFHPDLIRRGFVGGVDAARTLRQSVTQSAGIRSQVSQSVPGSSYHLRPTQQGVLDPHLEDTPTPATRVRPNTQRSRGNNLEPQARFPPIDDSRQRSQTGAADRTGAERFPPASASCISWTGSSSNAQSKEQLSGAGHPGFNVFTMSEWRRWSIAHARQFGYATHTKSNACTIFPTVQSCMTFGC